MLKPLLALFKKEIDVLLEGGKLYCYSDLFQLYCDYLTWLGVDYRSAIKLLSHIIGSELSVDVLPKVTRSKNEMINGVFRWHTNLGISSRTSDVVCLIKGSPLCHKVTNDIRVILKTVITAIIKTSDSNSSGIRMAGVSP